MYIQRKKLLFAQNEGGTDLTMAHSSSYILPVIRQIFLLLYKTIN